MRALSRGALRESPPRRSVVIWSGSGIAPGQGPFCGVDMSSRWLWEGGCRRGPADRSRRVGCAGGRAGGRSARVASGFRRGACRCRKLCHPMRPGRIHESGRGAGPGAEYVYPSLRWADAPPGGRVLLQRPVRPVDVVVAGVLAEDQPQVPSAGDQHPVQALAPGAGHPAFRDRIRAGRLERGLDDPRADRG